MDEEQVVKARAAVIEHFEEACADAAFCGGDPDDAGFGHKLDALMVAVRADEQKKTVERAAEMLLKDTGP